MHPVLRYGPEQRLVTREMGHRQGWLWEQDHFLDRAARCLPLHGQHAGGLEAPGLQNRLPPSMQG